MNFRNSINTCGRKGEVIPVITFRRKGAMLVFVYNLGEAPKILKRIVLIQ